MVPKSLENRSRIWATTPARAEGLSNSASPMADMATVAKCAFISDIHSNLEALRAVLDDIGETDVYCLGDIVGYGASPNEVVALLRERGATCIVGNHDFAVLSGKVNEFNARAVQA